MSGGPTWKLEEDLKTVTVTFPTDPPVALKLDTTDVENLLNNLGEFRALMQPQPAADWPPGQLVQAVPNPRGSTEREMMMGNTVLHLRDPRFGWLHYVLQREAARQLAQHLLAQADARPPGSGQEKPN